jgi:cytosine deaminase
MTRVPELMAAGVTVAFGHDCVMDPWYGMGSGDMLEVAHMGIHVAQMTSRKGIQACFDAVTTNAAKVMHLQGYGIEKGCEASFVLLQAGDVAEAVRLRAHRLQVWRRGHLLAASPATGTSLNLPGRPGTTDFTRVRRTASS